MTQQDAFGDGPVVVTGAGSGIGRALVLELAVRGVRQIVAADLDEAGAMRTAAEAGGETIGAWLDVTNAEAVAAAAARWAGDRGAIAAWFSNAGIQAGTGIGTADDWDRAIRVNLLAHVHAARAVLPGMERAGQGAFVVTASAAGLLMDPRTATYTASKHAAVGFTEWLAANAAEGVAIHCVCPEGVRTGMTTTDSSAATAEVFQSAEQVASAILDGVEARTFLILTHLRTAEFERRRADDRQRWLQGMRRARTRSLGSDRIFLQESETTL